MKKYCNSFFVLFIILILFVGNTYSQTLINFLNSNSRAMSMGGAFTSVYDIDNSPMWNPSISILEKDRKIGVESSYSKFELDLIPAGLAIVVLLLENLDEDTTDIDTDFLKTMGILLVYSFRGYTYSSDKYQIYLKLNEDLFDYDLTDTKRFFDNSQSMLAFSYQFGREFAVGVSFNYYQTYEKNIGRESGLGGCIGLSYNALAVNRLSYGLTYFKFPDNMKNVREMTERLFDNSINFGISYHYNYNYLVSLDVRDINHFDNASCLETHLGLEEKIVRIKNGNLYLRQGGYFLNNNSNKPVYSVGIGYKSDISFVKRDKLLNISFGIIVNKYQGIRNNLFFSTQINL